MKKKLEEAERKRDERLAAYAKRWLARGEEERRNKRKR